MAKKKNSEARQPGLYPSLTTIYELCDSGKLPNISVPLFPHT